jgi:very-short-patch-repair endonuclease
MSYNYNDQNLKPLRQILRRNQTDAERKLWNAIRNRQLLGLKFIRQYSVGNYILDFYCSEKRLAIELDGGQHADEENKKDDDERTAYLNQQDIKVIRFWNNDVLQNIEGVGESIISELTRR